MHLSFGSSLGWTALRGTGDRNCGLRALEGPRETNAGGRGSLRRRTFDFQRGIILVGGSSIFILTYDGQ